MTTLDRLTRWPAAIALLLGIPALAVRAGQPVNAEATFSVGAYLSDVLPSLLAVVLCGVAAAGLATGRRGLVAGTRWLGGGRSETSAAVAARALASAARGAVAAGLVLSIGALVTVAGFLRASFDGSPPPSLPFFVNGVVGGLLPAIWALLVGRCWLGSHASSASAAAGERPGRTLRGWSELAVPVLLVILPALLLLSTLYRHPTLAR